MGIVISWADIRNGRMKDTLLVYALEGETAIVETRMGRIAAEMILCRDTVAELSNSLGEYVVVAYGDIRDIHPVAHPAASAMQTSVVNASGNWVAPPERFVRGGGGALISFPGRSR